MLPMARDVSAWDLIVIGNFAYVLIRYMALGISCQTAYT